MAAQNKISHQVGEFQNDVFRFDIHGVKSDIAKQREEEIKRRILVNTYGTAFPMKMDFDRQILSRFQRPTGAIPSSMLGLEAVTGSLEDFGFKHYLNGWLLDRCVPTHIVHQHVVGSFGNPRESESFRPADLHHGMEVRIGLSKGPAYPSFI
ncbi:hypothetical protein KPL71_019134 [Citrus sinensis]|uniref:Uncharacterized protein n=1 Tax=Citrus sinensis TaxID=2711 RepID=A0ACB8K3I6_CITSI|nr:hypothetical protein KPL71_019134 [Citrus sinensis]